MRSFYHLPKLARAILLWSVLARGVAAEDGLAFFEAKIRPLLIEQCQKCHGEKKQENGLRLDSKAGWQKGGDHGAAIQPGDAENSLLIKAVLVVSARDFCNLQIKRDVPDGTIVSVAYSMPHEACPEEAGYVRGDVLPGSAWHLAPVPAADGSGGVHSRLTYVIFSDIKGWVPHFAINAAVAETFGTYYSKLREHVGKA